MNLHPKDYLLFVAWLSYTLAHPKVSTSKYLILILQGEQGSGKTSLCNNVILRLIDPSAIGVQRMQADEKDLAIAVQHAHVVAFDNVCGFKSSISDLFCIVSTGGQVTSRRLYTDAEQIVIHLHGALVLNGIHSFVTQSDLAQRCLTLQLLPIPDEKRQSDRRCRPDWWPGCCICSMPVCHHTTKETRTQSVLNNPKISHPCGFPVK